MKTTRRFKENKHSFYRKQHVILVKTTRRFCDLVLIFTSLQPNKTP